MHYFFKKIKIYLILLTTGLGTLDRRLFSYYEAILIYTKYTYHKDPSFNDYFKSLVQSIAVNNVHKLGTHLTLYIEPVTHSLHGRKLLTWSSIHSSTDCIH